MGTPDFNVRTASATIDMDVPFGHSKKVRSKTESVLVFLDVGGISAWGEGAPRGYVTGESLQSVLRDLANFFWGEALTELWGAQEIGEYVLGVEALRLTARMGNSAACAIETALIDLGAQKFSSTMTDVLRALQDGETLYRESPQAVEVAYVADSSEPVAAQLDRLARTLEGPVAHLKVKGKHDIHATVHDVLVAASHGAAENATLSVDANGVWTVDDCRLLNAAAEGRVSWLEEPVQPRKWEDLRQIRERTGLAVMLDESVTDVESLRTAFEKGAVDSVNLRVSKLGGLVSTAAVSREANELGLGFQVGVQVAEIGPLWACGRHVGTHAKGALAVEAGKQDKWFGENPTTVPSYQVDRVRYKAEPINTPGVGVRPSRYLKNQIKPTTVFSKNPSSVRNRTMSQEVINRETALLSSRAQGLSMSAPYAVPSRAGGGRLINFVNGSPALEALPIGELAETSSRVITENPAQALGYGPNAGDPGLRQLIASKQGVDASRVVITNGGLHGIELALSVVIDPGDTVLVDTPTFPDAVRVIENIGGNALPLETVQGRLDLDRLEGVLNSNDRPKIKAVYVLPDHHNPGGGTLSFSERERLLEIAERHGIFVLSDNPYRELYFDQQEPDFPLDSDNLAVAATFSKIFGPGLRVGWLILPEWAVPHVVNQRRRQDFQPPALSQIVVRDLLEKEKWYDEHVAKARAVYKRREAASFEVLESAGERFSFIRPQGGFFHWIRVADGISVSELNERAVKEGIVVSRGGFYDPQGGAAYDNFFRIAYSQVPEAFLRDGLEVLVRIARDLSSGDL